MSTKLREEQFDFLQKIKLLLSSPTQTNSTIDSQVSTKIDRISDLRIEDLLKRMEKIEGMLGDTEDEGVRKGKIKDQIVSLLQQYKKLTSSQLSKLIGLSRTRCSEYFRELTKEGKTEGVIINRQKYYKLVIK